VELARLRVKAYPGDRWQNSDSARAAANWRTTATNQRAESAALGRWAVSSEAPAIDNACLALIHAATKRAGLAAVQKEAM